MLPCPLLLQDGHRHALGQRPGPRPGLRALGRQPGRGSQCWDQSQTGQEVMEAPVAQSSRGQKVPQTLPFSDPAPAVRQAAADNGQAGCSQHPRGGLPESQQHRTNLLGPASLAPFFRYPHSLGSSQPPHPLPGPGGPSPNPGTALSPASPTGAGLGARVGTKQQWAIYFFSPFLFFNKKS